MCQVFLTEYEQFKQKMEDMEMRLAQVVCQAFDDCSGCEAALKVHILMPC